MTENTPLDPAEAVQQVDEAMAILPKKRLGCRGRVAKYAVFLLLVTVVFGYWNFFRTPKLKISKETTYITEPLTADGRVDYFAALEQKLYPPEMKTDDNGYRMIVRALGDIEARILFYSQDEETALDAKAHTAQVYEKLGLDPAIEPTLDFSYLDQFLWDYMESQGLEGKQGYELSKRCYQVWTLDDLPMMAPWLEQNGPALDLLTEAVRKPTYCIPLVRAHEDATLVDSPYFPGAQGTRSFSRMLLARANYRIGVGDIDGAIDDVITCERLGRHLENEETIISRLVGIAIEGMAASVGVAAVRESQPTEEQLQRLVDELNAIPPRPNMDRMWLTGRYYTLDWMQVAAHGEAWLAEFLGVREDAELPTIGVTTSLPIDWNIVMRRTNWHYDNLDENVGDRPEYWFPPNPLSLGNLFISTRSRYLADFLAYRNMSSADAIYEANRRANCTDNLQQITLAMLLYEHQHGTLPPAYTVDADAAPLHSWRVLLLPLLGQQELYDKIRLDEPWDSQHNRQFHETDIAIYQCPSAMLAPGDSNYSVVVGANMPFDAGEGRSLDDFGMNMILVVERDQSSALKQQPQAVCWMDPTSELTDVVASKEINLLSADGHHIGDGIGSEHPGGVNVGLRNGSARYLSETIDPAVLGGLLDGTAEGGGY